MLLLKYSNNFWRSLEMSQIICEINLILSWSASYVIVSAVVANQGVIFATTDMKLYVPVATLATQDNVKLLDLLKSGN